MLVWMRHEKHGRMPVYDHGAVDRAKASGWYVETDEPQAPATVVDLDQHADHEPIPEEAERAKLYALAEQRGIKVDRRWGLDRLRKAVGE